MERQNAGFGAVFVEDNERAGIQKVRELDQGADNWFSEMLDKDILRAHLNDAGRGGIGGGKDRAEIKIVRQDDVTVGKCPGEDGLVFGARVADGRPVNSLMARKRQQGKPVGRQVHVHDDLH